MRLICTTMILMVLAHPVLAATTYFCNTTHVVKIADHKFDKFKDFTFKMMVDAETKSLKFNTDIFVLSEIVMYARENFWLSSGVNGLTNANFSDGGFSYSQMASNQNIFITARCDKF